MTKPTLEERYKQADKELDRKFHSINKNYLLAIGAVALVVLAGIVGVAL